RNWRRLSIDARPSGSKTTIVVKHSRIANPPGRPQAGTGCIDAVHLDWRRDPRASCLTWNPERSGAAVLAALPPLADYCPCPVDIRQRPSVALSLSGFRTLHLIICLQSLEHVTKQWLLAW